MATTKPSDPRRPIAEPGAIARSLTTFAQALKWLFLALVFSILVEWIGMVLWWDEQGLDHSRQMLINELGFLENDFHRSIMTANPISYALKVVDRIFWVLFELTRVVDVIEWLAAPPEAGAEGIRPMLHEGYVLIADFVIAGIQITQVFSVRLAILTLATPLFALFGIVAVVDGLVQRDLRRWGGGRESSFVYHYAKKAALPIIVTAWVVYLALPFSLHPSWVILPFSLGFALTVTITASTFKKYL